MLSRSRRLTQLTMWPPLLNLFRKVTKFLSTLNHPPIQRIPSLPIDLSAWGVDKLSDGSIRVVTKYGTGETTHVIKRRVSGLLEVKVDSVVHPPTKTS